MPADAKKGIIFWLFAWVCLLTDFYILTADRGWVAKLAVAVVLLTYFMLTAQNWSRMIGLMASAMAVFFSAILMYAMRDEPYLLFLSAASLILFCLSLYFLFNKTTAQFFKSHSSSETKEDVGPTQ
jgi:hypothetical protein